MNRKKQLHYIYKDTLRHVTSYPDRWKRFLKFCDQVYPMSFENMVLLYGQDPKVTLLATEEQWRVMGRGVLDNAKELFAFDTSGDEIRAAKFFDVKQTDGEPVPDRWRLDEDTQRSYLNAINQYRSEPADSVEHYLRDMISKDVQNYGSFAEESFLKALRDREYNPAKVDSIQKSFTPMLERNIRYLVGNRCDFSMHSLPATAQFRYIRDFNDVYTATLFGVVSTDMARAVLTRVEHYVQRLEEKEHLIYETELYQAGTFSLSRNSGLERSEGRPSAGESREEDLSEAEAGEQVELYDAAGRRRTDGQDASGRGEGQPGASEVDRADDVERAASGGYGVTGAANEGNPGSSGRTDYPGDGAELELIALESANRGISSPNGELKTAVVYHGSFTEFDQFDSSKINIDRANAHNAYGEGIYFADTPEQARLYGDKIYMVELKYSTDRRTARKTGREKDFQYDPERGMWVIPYDKQEHLKILRIYTEDEILKNRDTPEPSKDDSIFMPEIVMEEELATVLLCLPEQPPAERQMALSEENLREAVGGPYMDIKYRADISCICKEAAVSGVDSFNRMVSGELVSGPIVFVHTNADGSYSSLSKEDLNHLKMKFAAPLIDAGREMDRSHALLNAVQTNDGEKVSRMLIGHKEDANKLIAGATPLHYAVEHGADKSAAALLKRGAYVDAINEERKTPLFRAVERGDAKITRQLLKAGADPELSDGKRFIQDITASKAIKSMLDEYTTIKQLKTGRSPSGPRRKM